MGRGLGRRFGPAFGDGDVVGCGVSCWGDLLGAADGPGPLGVVFFTLNGRLLPDPGFRVWKLQPGVMYPCVGLDSYAPVTFNFGASPFAFDVASVADLHHAVFTAPHSPRHVRFIAQLGVDRFRTVLRVPTEIDGMTTDEDEDDEVDFDDLEGLFDSEDTEDIIEGLIEWGDDSEEDEDESEDEDSSSEEEEQVEQPIPAA